MTSDRNQRRRRPEIERLEAIVPPSTIAPSANLVNLGTTALVVDLRNDLIRSTPHNGREGWSLARLDADPATRTLYGSARLLYRIKPYGAFTSYQEVQNLHVDITFALNLDHPDPRNVHVAIGHPAPGFGPNVRNTMTLGVVAFARQDLAQIDAALK